MHIHMMCIIHVDERRREIIFIDFAEVLNLLEIFRLGLQNFRMIRD